MDSLKFHHEDIAAVLTHIDASVTKFYRLKDQMDKKRQALDAWGNYLQAIVEGRKPQANVFDIWTAKETA